MLAAVRFGSFFVVSTKFGHGLGRLPDMKQNQIRATPH